MENLSGQVLVNQAHGINFLKYISDQAAICRVWQIEYRPFKKGIFLTVTFINGVKQSKKISGLKGTKEIRAMVYGLLKALIFSRLVKQDFFKHLLNVSSGTISKDISAFKAQHK